MIRPWPILLLAVVWAGFGGAGEPGSWRPGRLGGNIRWLRYEGNDRRVLDVPGYDMLVLDPDGIGEVGTSEKKGRIFLGTLNVGRVEGKRKYASAIGNKSWVLDPDPDRPDSRLVDVRSEEWRDLVVNTVAKGIIDAGYDGFVLTDADIAETLMGRDLRGYIGADDAMITLIRDLRKQYPKSIILVDGGVMIVPMIARLVDGFLCEATVSTRKDLGDGTREYGEISPERQAWLRPRLERMASAGLPIFTVEYVDPDDQEQQERVRQAVRRMGMIPFLTAGKP